MPTASDEPSTMTNDRGTTPSQTDLDAVAELGEQPEPTDSDSQLDQSDTAELTDGVRPATEGEGEQTAAEADADEAADTDAPERSRGQRALRAAVEWVLVIGGALLVAFLVKTFLVQAFWIPSPSMESTLQTDDRVLANKLADSISDLNTGDVVVFKRVDGPAVGADSDVKDLIKRVVGLPGDELYTDNGVLYVNGTRLDEPYLDPGTETSGLANPVTVPDDEIFVMGDNRGDSHDSRNFGSVPEENIVGRAFIRIWPPSRIGRL